jgi:DNA-binding GntR family transcriptional regulator
LSSSQRAAAELRALVFDGKLPPGSDHLETELAERLGMSRTPVREAMQALAAQGLVETRPRRGMRVLPVSPQDMAEIYDILTELESLAAERAASQGYAAVDLVQLGQSIDRMDAALAQGDRAAWALADDAFHAELVRLGGNGRMVAIVAMMVDQVRRARAVTLHMRPLPLRSNQDHRRVHDAILRGQPQEARRLHRAHRSEAGAMLVALLKQHQLNRL